MEDNDMNIPNSVFIFNLGRLWQEVISEHWDKVEYLNKFVKEITPAFLLKKYSKELRYLQLAINRQDCNNIDKSLGKILKW